MSKSKGKTSYIKLFFISFLVTITFTMVLLATLVVVKPDTVDIIKEADLSFLVSDKEYHSNPIDFVAEIKQKEGDTKRTYISASISASTPKNKYTKVLREEKHKLIDLYIRYTSSKTEDELDIEGESGEKVKSELAKVIEKELDIEVKDIYFTKWIFQ